MFALNNVVDFMYNKNTFKNDVYFSFSFNTGTPFVVIAIII